MSLILVILDGMTEHGLTECEPYVLRSCETLKRLTREGGFGMLQNTPQGLPVDSLTCIGTLLGVPAQRIPKGRAFLEAMAARLTPGPNDAVCRLNLTELDANGNIVGASAILSAAESQALCASISDERCQAHHLVGYKNLMVMRNFAQAVDEVKANPPHQHPNELAHELLPQGGELGAYLHELAINSRFTRGGVDYMLFPWDISVRPDMPQFSAIHAMRAACICKTEIVHGLCLAMGIEVFCPNGATAEVDTDLSAKAHAVLDAAKTHEVTIVHVNGADELAHRCDASGKAEFLRRADVELLAPLVEGLPNGGRLLICSDHATNAQSGRHEGGAQPFVLWQKGGEPKGWLGVHSGTQAIELLAKAKE